MSSEALGNRSADIVRILVLFMTTAGDGASGSCCSFLVVVILRNKMVVFGVDALVC